MTVNSSKPADLDLTSKSPMQRARIVAWLSQNPDDVSTVELLRAIQSETVPRLRQTLAEILQVRQAKSTSATHEIPQPDENILGGRSVQDSATIASMGALIRHELAPAIGWIRVAASRELVDFDSSKTNVAIEKLRRRVDGLVVLLTAANELVLQPYDLLVLLRDGWPRTDDEAPIRPGTPEPGRAPVLIKTEPTLMNLLLGAAYQNAIDAAAEVSGAPEIAVHWGSTREGFWVRVTNPFSGNQFDVADVEATGKSTKSSHQGRGVSLMRQISVLLGLELELNGRSGIATMTIRGKEHVV